MERWTDITGYEGMYQVSDMGNVRSLDRREPLVVKGTACRRSRKGRILSPRVGLYRHIELSRNGIKTEITVAKLVAIAFLANPLNKPTPNHIDGDKHNDVLSNLEWNTHAENTQHAYDTGLAVAAKGSEHVAAKLTEQQVLQMRQAYATGATQRVLATEFHISRTQVSFIVRGLKWKHAGGPISARRKYPHNRNEISN